MYRPRFRTLVGSSATACNTVRIPQYQNSVTYYRNQCAQGSPKTPYHPTDTNTHTSEPKLHTILPTCTRQNQHSIPSYRDQYAHIDTHAPHTLIMKPLQAKRQYRPHIFTLCYRSESCTLRPTPGLEAYRHLAEDHTDARPRIIPTFGLEAYVLFSKMTTPAPNAVQHTVHEGASAWD